jgi:hypothetical protein
MAKTPTAGSVHRLEELTSDPKGEAARPGELSAFDEYAYSRDAPDDEDRTRLTIRFATAPSRWRTVRWCVCLLMVMAAAAAGGRLMSARRANTPHHPRGIEPRVAAGPSPLVAPRSLHHRSRRTRARPAGARRSRPPIGRRRDHRRARGRRRLIPRVPASSTSVESSPADSRAETRRSPPIDQFSYLGNER